MKIIKTRRRYNSFLFFNRDRIFRDELIIMNKMNGHTLFLTSFNNPYFTYEVISVPVPNGTYKIKILSEDDLLNRTTGQEGIVVIAFYVLPPKNVQASLSGSNVTFIWEHPSSGAPDNYIIYGNNGSGNIDRSTILATVLGSALTHTLTSLANGSWKFVVESKKNGVTSNTGDLKSITIPASSTPPEKPGIPGTGPFAVTGLELSNVSIGKVKIRFFWTHGTNASHFRVYHDNGTGTVDYDNYAFRFARQSTLIQEYITAQIHSTDSNLTYKFAVRAESPDGIVETNEDEYQIDIDGEEPDEVQDLELDSIF